LVDARAASTAGPYPCECCRRLISLVRLSAFLMSDWLSLLKRVYICVVGVNCRVAEHPHFGHPCMLSRSATVVTSVKVRRHPVHL